MISRQDHGLSDTVLAGDTGVMQVTYAETAGQGGQEWIADVISVQETGLHREVTGKRSFAADSPTSHLRLTSRQPSKEQPQEVTDELECFG